MAKIDILLGLQWGDEGKGKQIDELLPRYDGVARFQGGDNAGHTIKLNGVSIVGHLLPSAFLREGAMMIIGNGLVLNPVSLIKEINQLKERGIDVSNRLYISERAKLVTYLHPFIDQAEETRLGKSSVGTTLRGIGPAYSQARGRQGLLVGEVLGSNYRERLETFIDFQMTTLSMYDKWGFEIPTEKIKEAKEIWDNAVEEMKKLKICDVSALLRKELAEGKKIMAEGAQGAMLDFDFGDYPNVTSSNTLSANVCLGLGVPHTVIGDVCGVVKAYVTKVGGGYFPSRIKDEEVEKLFQEAGGEFGATTGRRRMCGWMDLPALRHAIYLSGTTKLFINKTDICPVDTVKVVTGYVGKDGKVIDHMPFHLNEIADVVTKDFKGWGNYASGINDKSKLPVELINYINYIQEQIADLGVKIEAIGTGPDRNQSVSW